MTGINLRPLTLQTLPPVGRPCLVVGTLSDWPGGRDAERWDVAVLMIDANGVMWFAGNRFRWDLKIDSPAVRGWVELPAAGDVEVTA